MSLNERLQKEIDRHPVPLEILDHYTAFTAQRVAQAAHVPGHLLAKPVVVREEGGEYYMAVVTAPQHADLNEIRRVTGRPKGHLADERELLRLFPDCEIGAMPPIGRLYGMPTYLDVEFRNHADIYFQSGNHREVVKMKFAAYEKLAGPFAGEFSLHREESKLGG